MTWVEKHGINCYSCNKLFDEREAIHVKIKNEDHEICEECAEGLADLSYELEMKKESK